MKAKNSGDYYNLAREVIYSEFEIKGDATKLTRPDINRKVCSLLREKKPGITTKRAQTSVHRALETLVNEKIVFLYDETYYYPNTASARRVVLRSKIEALPFNKDGIFFVSSSTVMLSIRGLYKKETSDTLDNEDNDSVETGNEEKTLDRKEVRQLFKDYLSEENCFSVEITKKYVVLLIKGSAEELTAIGKDLENIAKNSYELQSKKKKKLRKKETSKKVVETEEQETQEQTERK